MTSETQALIGLAFTGLCLFGLLSGAFTDRPRLRRNLQTWWVRERPAAAPRDWVPLIKVVLALTGYVGNLLFLALVAWAAVDGGVWGLGFAIFVALGYLQSIRNSLWKLEPAAKEDV